MAHNWKNVDLTNVWRCKRCGSEMASFKKPSEQDALRFFDKRCEEVTVARIHDE